MDIMNILSLACIIVTIISFTAGMPDFVIILKQKCTGSTPFLPFLMGLVTNIGCFLYGLLKWDVTILVVNSVGSVLHTFYVLVYLSYSSNKTSSFKQFMTAMLLMLGSYLYLTLVVGDRGKVENHLGLATCILILFANISPIAELRTIIRSRSSASLSFPWALGIFMNSLLWSMYGMAIQDIYVLIPSLPGVCSSLLQFYLLLKYPAKKVD